jgi:hypothetical protein
MSDVTETPLEGRVLLLEFVSHERWVFDSRLYPYIKGAAAQLGFATRWLCFGAEPRMEKLSDTSVDYYMDLGPDELALLRRHVAELAPTHVVISHPVPRALLDELTRGRDDVSVLCTSDHPAPDGTDALRWYALGREEGRGVVPYEDEDVELTLHGSAPERAGEEGGERDLRDLKRLGGDAGMWLMARTDWLLSWLGVTPESDDLYARYLIGTFSPDYDVVMGNEKARAFKPHVLILGGVACDHFAKVATNPHYAAIDVAATSNPRGCAYCTWYRGPNSDLRTDPVAIAEEQLRRLRDTAGPEGRYCGVVDLLDIRVLGHVDRFAEMVVGLGLPPTTFCFEPRIDRVLRARPRLERALATLAPAGHSIYLFRMGAESLVEEENELYNKHLTLAQLDHGHAALAELQARFPGVLDFDPTWGYISCSPWTTLEMLETGIERALERSFDPLGIWLYTPLLLYAGSAITRLAEKQGDIIVEAFDDASLLYEAAVNGVAFDCLIPWRFRDDRTGVAFSLMARFCAAALRSKYPDTIFHGDPLYEQLLARAADIRGFDRPDLFARHVVALVKAGDAPYDRAALLHDALTRYRDLPERRPVPSAEAAEAAASGDATGAEGRGREGGEGGDGAAARPFAPDERTRRLGRLLEAVRRHLDQGAGRFAVRGLERVGAEEVWALPVEIEGARYELVLRRLGATQQPVYVRARHFGAAYENATPLTSEAHVRVVQRLLRLLDQAVERHAPDLLAAPSAADQPTV